MSSRKTAGRNDIAPTFPCAHSPPLSDNFFGQTHFMWYWNSSSFSPAILILSATCKAKTHNLAQREHLRGGWLLQGQTVYPLGFTILWLPQVPWLNMRIPCQNYDYHVHPLWNFGLQHPTLQPLSPSLQVFHSFSTINPPTPSSLDFPFLSINSPLFWMFTLCRSNPEQCDQPLNLQYPLLIIFGLGIKTR